MLLFFLLQNVLALNISFIENTNSNQVNISLTVESQSYIERLDHLGNILSVKFVSNDTSLQFCTPYYQGITIHQLQVGFVSLIHELNRKDIDQLSEYDLYQGYNEKMSSYAQNNDGICILSSKGTVFYISNSNPFNLTIINDTLPYYNEQEQQSTSELVYDERSKYFFAFVDQNVYRFQFFNDKLISQEYQGWQKPKYQYKVIASNGWLYSAQQEEGLFIYEIQQQSLKLNKILTSLDLYDFQTDFSKIIDVAVSEDKLYILDSIHGITAYHIYFNGTFIKNEKLGLIKITDGVSFTISDKTIIVIQNFKTSSSVIELYIEDDQWIEMRKIITKTKLRQTDIIDNIFAIVRGLHDHKIMLTKENEIYMDQDAKRIDNYFFSGNLIGVNKFGLNDQSNDKLFAISPHGFYLFQYKPYPSIIICNSNELESGKYSVNMEVKSTNCPEKQNKEDNLQYCITQQQYNFDVKKPLLSPEMQQAYIYMAILLGSLAIILILCLGYFYRRYQLQMEKIRVIQKDQQQKKNKK